MVRREGLDLRPLHPWRRLTAATEVSSLSGSARVSTEKSSVSGTGCSATSGLWAGAITRTGTAGSATPGGAVGTGSLSQAMTRGGRAVLRARPEAISRSTISASTLIAMTGNHERPPQADLQDV